jgi:hypothetical protein
MQHFLHSANLPQINLYGRKKGYLNTELSKERLERKEQFCREYLEALDIIDRGISHNRGEFFFFVTNKDLGGY